MTDKTLQGSTEALVSAPQQYTVRPGGLPGHDITPDDKGSYHAIMAGIDLQAELAALTPHTRRAYNRALRQFREYCDSNDWTAPTHDLLRRPVLQAWIAHLQARELSSGTIGQYVAAVRWAAGLAADQGLVDESTHAALARVKVKGGAGVRQGRWLDAADLVRLITAPQGARHAAARDRAVLAVLAGCGLRRSELCRLTMAHLEERDGRPWALVNLTGKGDKVRSVRIPALVRPYLARWLRYYRQAHTGRPDLPGHGELTEDDPLLAQVRPGGHGTITREPMSPDSVYRIIRQATAAADLPDLAPHDLRRTAAKLMSQGGASLVEIRDVLGHASVATTERYLATAAGPATGTLAIDKAIRAT